jgi:hypothetical protein
MDDMTDEPGWPSLPIAEWQDTRDTLILWTQVVGKIRLANTPLIFYSYAYPEPEGFPDAPVRPEGASYSKELGEFVLPYELVRTSRDADATLLAFLQTSYEAAAVNGAWDRPQLERRTG